MAAVLDISRIEKELQEINQQRSEARERLGALAPGRGRGRGPPGGGGGGRGEGRPAIFSRLGDSSMNGGAGPRDPSSSGRPSVFDRLYHSQGSRGSRDRYAAPGDDGRQPGRQLSSRVSSEVVAPPARGDRGPPPREHADPDRERHADPAAGRKRLLSAVMVNGQARQLSGSLDSRLSGAEPAAAEERPAKRPTLAVDDKTKRRAARMFGTLLVGTLQKFQNDEQAFKKTDTAQRRAEMERRAQERAEAEAQRLRQQAADTLREERENKLNTLHDLNLQADVKALQLRYAKRIQLRQQLAGFCVTTTQPSLYWLPKQASQESEALLQASVAAFEAWKQQQLQELEAEQAELQAAAAAKRESALARLAARRPPAAGEAAAGDEDEEGEEGQAAREEGAAAREGSRQQQYSEGEEQQQQDEDMAANGAESGDDAEQQQEEQEQQQQQRRVQRSRHVGSDDDEEHLLSSDDEDA